MPIRTVTTSIIATPMGPMIHQANHIPTLTNTRR